MPRRSGCLLLALGAVGALILTFGWLAILRPALDRRAARSSYERFAEAARNDTREQVETRITKYPFAWEYVVNDSSSYGDVRRYASKRQWATIRTHEKDVQLEYRMMTGSVARCTSEYARMAFDDHGRANAVTYGTYECPSL